eukprot:Seg724.12 transcript_id=Seg724.12/GoldUCD/mRNA.D3Y31 product="UPF0598 protein C8orf82" protein_id=Seg724.12/GoldUCD/D3Y31
MHCMRRCQRSVMSQVANYGRHSDGHGGPKLFHFGIGHRYISYVQGQSPRRGVREYFYYIDHQGQLFLDDTKVKNFITCFKEKQFLAFFFRRLKLNKTGVYENDFPYISPCGKELNYIRCEDRPIVFSHIIQEDESLPHNASWQLTYNGIGPKLKFDFQPEKLCMLPLSGRIYHPAPDKVGGIGLVKSSLAIEISRNFLYKVGEPEVDPPTHFVWNDVEYELDNELWNTVNREDLTAS